MPWIEEKNYDLDPLSEKLESSNRRLEGGVILEVLDDEGVEDEDEEVSSERSDDR